MNTYIVLLNHCLYILQGVKICRRNTLGAVNINTHKPFNECWMLIMPFGLIMSVLHNVLMYVITSHSHLG